MFLAFFIILISSAIVGNEVYKVDQKHFFKLYATAEETQHGWCKKRKLNVSDLDDHPNIKGQEAWAEELLPHVKDILNAD